MLHFPANGVRQHHPPGRIPLSLCRRGLTAAGGALQTRAAAPSPRTTALHCLGGVPMHYSLALCVLRPVKRRCNWLSSDRSERESPDVGRPPLTNARCCTRRNAPARTQDKRSANSHQHPTQHSTAAPSCSTTPTASTPEGIARRCAIRRHKRCSPTPTQPTHRRTTAFRRIRGALTAKHAQPGTARSMLRRRAATPARRSHTTQLVFAARLAALQVRGMRTLDGGFA